MDYSIQPSAELPGDFTPAKFNLVADLVDVLGPLSMLQIAIQSSAEPTSHVALPSILRLVSKLWNSPGTIAKAYS